MGCVRNSMRPYYGYRSITAPRHSAGPPGREDFEQVEHIDDAVAGDVGGTFGGLVLVCAHVDDGRGAGAGVFGVGIIHEARVAVEVGDDVLRNGGVVTGVDAGGAGGEAQVVVLGAGDTVGPVGIDERRVLIDVPSPLGSWVDTMSL